MLRFSLVLGAICFVTFMVVLFNQPSPGIVLPLTTTANTDKLSVPHPVNFEDVSLDWGVTASHRQISKHLSALTETLGSGICAIDVNKDSWMDLFFVGGSGHNRHYGKKSWWHKESGNRLLLNQQGKYFTDVTKQAGLDQSMWAMACSSADFDNDGLADLFITGVGVSRIFKNKGDGSFVDVSANSGIQAYHWSTGIGLADFNQDGLMDIYISNYTLYKKNARTFEFSSGFHTNMKIAFDPTLYDPEPNRLYLNQGNMQFKEVANELGVSNAFGRSLGARWLDINQDKWPDLLVINEHNTPNQLFINNGGHSFSRRDEGYAAFEVAGAHDIAIADFNNDGNDEYFMSRGTSHPPVMLDDIRSTLVADKVNQSSNFNDIAWQCKLAQAKLLPNTGWGTASGDFNNDGFIDIYVANGMVLPDIDARNVPQAQANSLFINQGDGSFELMPASTDRQTPYSSRGAITADLNNDGRLEVVVSNNNNALQIFANQAINDHHWLGLDLLQDNKTTDVYGSTIELSTETLSIRQILQAKQGFLSQSDPRIHIGLGQDSVIKELIIHWQGGQQSLFKDLKADQYYVINQADNSIKPQQFVIAKNTHFDSSLADLNESTLLMLTEVLLQVSSKNRADSLLQVWKYGSATVRQIILDYFSEDKNWDTYTLKIIRQALADKESETRLKAINLLKQAELEISVAWLIPLLHDKDQGIQCAVADTFGFFFDEEEAVTHRKKLALSPLIKLLETGSSSAQICAANALAAAENKRAILPLLKLSLAGQSNAVQIAAIRALGLIRDTRAKATLTQLINKPESTTAVIGSVLIALKRLHDSMLETHLVSVFSHREPAALIRGYRVLSYLFTQADGIVFSKSKLEHKLSELISASKNNLSAASNQKINQQLLIVALQAIQDGKISEQYKLVSDLLNHPNHDIRLQAFKTIAALKISKAKKDFEQTLLKQPRALMQSVITHMRKSNLSFSSAFVHQLSKQSKSGRRAFNNTVGLLSYLPEKSARKLFSTMLVKELTETQINVLLQYCSPLNLKPSLPDKGLWQHTSAKVRHDYIDCFFSGNDIVNKSNTIRKNSTIDKSRLMQRMMLKSFLTDPVFDRETKNKLLLKAARKDSVIANTMLKKKVKTLSIEQQGTALDILVSHGLSSDLESILWQQLYNNNESNERRLQSAKLLVKKNEDKVFAYLLNRFFQ